MHHRWHCATLAGGMPLLKLDHDDPVEELKFEASVHLAIPPADRLQQWLEWNLTMLEFVAQQKHEPQQTATIVKRP